MAGITCIAQSPEVALTGTVAKTVVYIKAPSNHKLKVLGWGIFFDGISSTAEPVQVELLRQTTDSTVTSLTPAKLGNDSETVQTTAGHTASAEGTAGDILDCIEVHPQSGFEKIFAIGQEIAIPGGGRLAVKATAPAAVNCRAKIIFEE